MFFSYFMKNNTTNLPMNTRMETTKETIMYFEISNNIYPTFTSSKDFLWTADSWIELVRAPSREYFPTHRTAILPSPSTTLLPPIRIGLDRFVICLRDLSASSLPLAIFLRDVAFNEFFLAYFFNLEMHFLLAAFIVRVYLDPTFYSTVSSPSIIIPSAPIMSPLVSSTMSPTTKLKLSI